MAAPDADEELLLERIATGDASAVARSVERFGGLVWALARRLLRNEQDAEEAVQDVFAAVWSSAARYDRSKSSEETFVTTIARRRIIDRQRQIGRRAIPTDVDVETIATPQGDDPVEQANEVAEVRRALAQLQPDVRRVIRLSIYEGLSHGEISDTLGVPLGTVKSRIRRGLERARQALGVTEPGGGRED